MELQYRGKHILAPMVCGVTLPFRMLAAKYGADITYGEEIVDHRLLRCTRKINKILGTVDWWRSTRTLLFSGHVTKRRVVWFSKLGLLMLCRLYKLLVL
jgi:tRNA-dihydrouridine synthase